MKIYSGLNNTYCLKSILPILLLFAFEQCHAQNLVPNPSFEEHSSCPSNLQQIAHVIDWAEYTPSPDYFNFCAGQSSAGVPSNMFGFQYPATGSGYIGLLTYYEESWGSYNSREFAGAELLDPLEVGSTYYVSLKVSASGLSEDIWPNSGSNNLGVWFTSNPSLSNTNNLSQVYSVNIITDTLGWQVIQGEFIADSNYTHIVLGNFFEDSLTDAILLYNQSWTNHIASYYYIDDVCVSREQSTCVQTTSINNIPKPEKKLLRIVDLMGKDTEEKNNTLLIYIYNDGSRTKIYRQE
ncbi:MAG: hypothetical protein MK105_09725 [Crocinitomicaceae bacterium]|nr:hypothetical protein [Crocinitomicaceae bacterium]